MKLFVFGMMILICFYRDSCFCQSNTDSSLVSALKLLKQQLNLSDASADTMLTIGKTEMRQLDSLNKLNSLNINERKIELIVIQNEYHNNIQALLSSAQWLQFIQIEQARTDSFLLVIKSKNKHVKMLGD